MPNFTDLTGLASVASAMAASPLLLPWSKRISDRHRAWATGAVFVIALIPFGGFPLAAYVRGATGDLSITTLVILWCALLRPWFAFAANYSRQRVALLALIVFAAVALYPMALGFGSFDPYRLGYGNWAFVLALLLASLTAWGWKNYPAALCVALAALAWAIGWYESGNLWDYLLDPFVAIYALATLLTRALTSIQSVIHNNERA